MSSLPNEISNVIRWSSDMDAAPKDEDSLLLWSEEFIDNDFNRSGVIEGYYLDDPQYGKVWMGSFWNGCQDTYDSRPCKPTWWALKRPPYVITKTCD